MIYPDTEQEIDTLARRFRLAFMEEECTEVGWQHVRLQYENMLRHFIVACQDRGFDLRKVRK